MNRAYLFGKIISKSKLKYIISPKLQVYISIVIETISGEKFKCIVNENILSNTVNISLMEYVYVIAECSVNNDELYLICKEIYS